MIGRVPDATRSLKTWLAALACQKPKEFGYPHELWTIPLRRACPLIRTVGGASHATSPQQTLAMGDSALQYAALSGGYWPSQASSKRQPLNRLLTMIVIPCTARDRHVPNR